MRWLLISLNTEQLQYIINNFVLEFYSTKLFKWLHIIVKLFQWRFKHIEYLKTVHLKIDLLLLAIAKNVRPNLHSVEEHVYVDIYKYSFLISEYIFFERK